MTKLTATPADVALRNSIPTTTVHSHTTTPVGTTAAGCRQARLSSQPTAAPTRNGHAVSATPATVRPSAWLRRPTVQNSSTPTMSASAANVLLRFIGHHVEDQWADRGLVTGGEPGLHRRRLALQHRVERLLRDEPVVERERVDKERQAVRPQRIGGAHHMEVQMRRIGVARIAQRGDDLT